MDATRNRGKIATLELFRRWRWLLFGGAGGAAIGFAIAILVQPRETVKAVLSPLVANESIAVPYRIARSYNEAFDSEAAEFPIKVFVSDLIGKDDSQKTTEKWLRFRDSNRVYPERRAFQIDVGASGRELHLVMRMPFVPKFAVSKESINRFLSAVRTAVNATRRADQDPELIANSRLFMALQDMAKVESGVGAAIIAKVGSSAALGLLSGVWDPKDPLVRAAGFFGVASAKGVFNPEQLISMQESAIKAAVDVDVALRQRSALQDNPYWRIPAISVNARPVHQTDNRPTIAFLFLGLFVGLVFAVLTLLTVENMRRT